jgi:hypothetical protein
VLPGPREMTCRRRRPKSSFIICVVTFAAGIAPLSMAAPARDTRFVSLPALPVPACSPDSTSHLPARPARAETGSEFVRTVRNLSGIARDALVRSELAAGNFPHFLRHLAPVTLRTAGFAHTLTVCVLPDYLAVGDDQDFVFVPMGLPAALDLARRFGFELPTPKIVDAIYEESPVKLRPLPLPASERMRSTAYFAEHNHLISHQRAAFAAPLGTLTAGHKKDLVLTVRLWEIPGRVAIYGWHRNMNAPIQPLSTVHGARYADYSHGVRLVSKTIYVDGVARSIEDVLAQPDLAPLLTYEGALPRLAQRLTELQQRNPR